MRLLPFALGPAMLSLVLLPGCAGSGDAEAPTARTGPSSTAPADPADQADTRAEAGTSEAMTRNSAGVEPVSILAKVTGSQLPISDPMLGRVNDAAVAQLGLIDVFADEGLELDPSKHSVILLSLGEQATGGYTADIESLQLKGNELFVKGTASAPGGEGSATQATTYPFCAVAIDQLPSGVKVRSDIRSE
jgi:hypothetical protein